MGHSADLSLESVVNFVGLLSSSFVNEVIPDLHTLGPADYRFSWVQDSHFCSGGRKGLFFSVSPGGYPPRGYPHWGVLGLRYQNPPPYLPPSPVTMSWLLPTRVALWMVRTAPPYVVRIGLTTISNYATASLHTTLRLLPPAWSLSPKTYSRGVFRRSLRGLYQL
jgi:hypothetical protein